MTTARCSCAPARSNSARAFSRRWRRSRPHELGLAPERVRVLAADTLHGPDEGVTSGSKSVHDAGAALRQACVQARERASNSRDAAAAPAVVGQSLPRVDLPAKLAGRPSYIHDLSPAGLLHGRVLHPPRPDSQFARGGHGRRRRRARADRRRIATASCSACCASAARRPIGRSACWPAPCAGSAEVAWTDERDCARALCSNCRPPRTSWPSTAGAPRAAWRAR